MGTFLWLMLLFPGVCGLSSSVPRQFHVVKEEKTWTDAQHCCREKFTDLATVDDMAEIEKSIRIMQDEGVTGACIGLTYGNSPKWQWSLADRGFYGENEAEFRNWDTGQPDGRPGEDCVLITEMGWYDYYCTDLYPFICQDGRNSTHPYVLIEDKESWPDAQRYCREHFTDLASVRNQAENVQIQALLPSGVDYNAWIGLFRDAWQWSDGSSSSFRHWAPGEPSSTHGNEFCVEMWSTGLWNDIPCDLRRFYICYEALPTVEVMSPQSPFYPGDRVTMRCDIPRYTDNRQYVWLKDNTTVAGETSQTITITLPEDAGQYQCHRKRVSTVSPYVSKPVNITCNDLPAATVEVVSPPGPHYSGDVVTLKCSVTQLEDWHQYAWLKDNSTATGETSQTTNITLPLEAGRYHCYRQREDGSKTSSPSKSVDIRNDDNLVLVRENKTWVEALQYCRQHHVDLVSVSSEKIQRWVEGWARGASSPHVWLGLRYDCNLGVWLLVSGVTASYDNWVSGADRDGGCYGTTRAGAVARDGGQWVSLDGNEKLNFICTNEAPSVWRTQIVRVNLQMASHVDVEDPEVQEAFLQQIKQRLKDKGLPANTQVSWRKQADGKVFHKEKKEVKKKQKRNEL